MDNLFHFGYQGGDERALKLFDQARSCYEDGVRDTDPKWAWWVDERELAWHEGMALADLGHAREAVENLNGRSRQQPQIR